MSSIAEYIKMQNRINEQFGVPKAVSAITMDRSLIACADVARQAANIQLEPALFGIVKELQKYNEMHESIYKSTMAMQRGLGPVLEEYNSISGLVNTARMVQESIQPIADSMKGIQSVLQDTQVLSQLADIRNHVLKEPSVWVSLQEAVKNQIDTSLWEDNVQQTDFNELQAKEMKEDILMLTEEDDKAGYLSRFFEKWGIGGKTVIIIIVSNILSVFFSGLLERYMEPVYKVLTPSFLLQEEHANTENRIEIPVNTEIHVWNDVTSNLVEITYKTDDTEYQGYMTQEEFEANTEMISDGVKLEHIVFVSDVTQLLSDKWHIQPEQAYNFLKNDTDLVNEYLLKHYDVLGLLDESELVENIEKYCEQHEISIPAVNESDDNSARKE